MSKDIQKITSENKSYKVLKKLGEGGTSIVYLVEDEDRQKLALKILGEEVDKTFLDRYIEILKNEFEVLSQLRHPNIARVYDFEFCQELNKYFFTTEYVEGTDILTFTEHADFRMKEELFVQFLNALDYVHRNGLIHSDIKCGNILVTMVKDAPVVKLLDFGFATKHMDESKYVVGTLHYLAPEQVLKTATIDSRVDTYAAGIVFYRLLHRKYPCPFDQVKEVLEWHQTRDEFPYADNLPDYVKNLISRMTAIYPSDRFPSPAKAIEFVNNRTEGRYNKLVSKMASLMPGEGALVGREEILQKIGKIIEEIKTKKTAPQMGVLFTGSQGIGKSRLLKEIKYRMELAEVPMKEIVCEASKDLVSNLMAQFKDVDAAALAGLDASKPDATRNYKIIQWISDVISKYEKKGLAIFIDDMQFSNQPFIDLILEFEKRIVVNREQKNNIPIFLIVASRPKDDAPDFVQKWLGKTALEVVDVPLLTKKDIAVYAESIGVRDFEKHKDAIMKFSGGVPQLVEAYCQHLMSPKGMARPPETLTQSYLGRMKALSSRPQVYLKVLSLIHKSLGVDELAEILDEKSENISGIVQELMQSNFVKREYPSMQVAIENNAMAQTIKDNLKEDELKDISCKIGKWLEIHEPESYVELADYFVNTDDAIRARKYSIGAAKRLEHIYSCTEAMKYYELAKKYTKDALELDDIGRAQAKLNLIAGRFNDTVKILEKFDSVSKANIDDYQTLGNAYIKMHEFDKARHWYETGLGHINDETAITDIVSFKNNLGNIYFYMGDLEKSEKYFTEAIADATTCLLLDNNLGLILNAKGKYKDAIDFYEGRKKFLEAKNNKRALSLCFAESGYIHMVNHHLMESLSDFEKSYELSTQIDDWHNILIVLGNLIRVYQQLAQYTKALECAQKSLKLEGKIGSLEDIAQTHLTVGVLYESLGVFDLAKQHIDMARDRFIAVQNRLMIGWCHLTNAYMYKDLDNFSAAFAELDKLDRLVGEIKDEDLKVWSKLTQADLYMEKKEFDKVKKLLGELTKDPGGEFSLRKKLLEIKLESLGGDVIYHEKFDALADECEKNYALELQWEVYASLGEIYEAKNQPGKNLNAYVQANEIIEAIAKGLSEAYRDSYKQQRSRKKVIERVSPKPVDRKSMRIERAGVEGEESVYEERTADLSKEFKKK